MPAQAAHHLLYCLCHGHGRMCSGDQLVSSVRAGSCSSTRLWGVALLPTPTVLLLHTGQGHSKVNSVTTQPRHADNIPILIGDIAGSVKKHEVWPVPAVLVAASAVGPVMSVQEVVACPS